MPPKRRINNKKRGKRCDKNVKSTSCEGCGKHLPKAMFIYCVCTTVRFCSSSCQQRNPHKNCVGAPKRSVNLNSLMKEATAENDVGRDPTSKAKHHHNIDMTVTKPSMKYLVTVKGMNPNQIAKLTADDYAECADEGDTLGHQACAFLAGSRYKHRLLSPVNGRGVVKNAKTDNSMPILESNELAFHYFKKAAFLGHGLAMQSLGECFWEGIGCKSNKRRCNQWLWKSCLLNTTHAIEMLDSKALLPLELNAHKNYLSDVIQKELLQEYPGQKMNFCGPNLSSLILALHPVVKHENFSLPPFAGSWATGTVNNRYHMNFTSNHRTPLIGSNEIRELMNCLNQLRAGGNDFGTTYGRRGTAKEATALTLSDCERQVENLTFFVPPLTQCDERVTEEERKEWNNKMRNLLFRDNPESLIYSHCTHVEEDAQRFSTERIPRLVCSKCEKDAMDRLDAVSNGSIVLSLEEELSCRGQAAIYRCTDSSIKIETWKTYCVGEAECCLALLAASEMSPYCFPLFIAQDPNFYWPLIADHGSIRAALEFVAPHIDWDKKIGKTKEQVQDLKPLLNGGKKFLKKCGNTFCTKLMNYKSKDFSYCNACNRRAYCSTKCQTADWRIHRRECTASIEKQNDHNLHLDIIPGYNSVEEDGTGLPKKFELKLQRGDDAIVHGLKSKVEFNGRVGTVDETKSNGRIALHLKSSKDAKTTTNNSIAIKPENLFVIGAFVKSRKRKSKVFQCVHGQKVCHECYFDFSIVNRLAQLKYQGENINNSFVVNQVNETYFSSKKLPDNDETFGRYPEGFPMECYGMEEHVKQRFILKALIETEDELTLPAAGARVAYITYGGLKNPSLRPNKYLESVAKLL